MTIPYADLTISSVTVPSDGDSGQPLRVTWQVRNDGIGITNTTYWNDVVRLASDPAGNNIVTNLGTYDHKGALAVGDTYTRAVDAVIPNGLSGAFYAVVTTSGPFEFIYTDNNKAVSGPVNIMLSPAADLAVTAITAPAAAVGGQKVDISWTVLNDGEADATGSWVDNVELRRAGQTGGSSMFLGQFTISAGLGAGKSYPRTEQFTLPATLEGLWQVFVTTNATNTLYEHGATANNTFGRSETMLVSLPMRPDLQVESVTAPASVSAYATLTVEFEVDRRAYDNIFITWSAGIGIGAFAAP